MLPQSAPWQHTHRAEPEPGPEEHHPPPCVPQVRGHWALMPRPNVQYTLKDAAGLPACTRTHVNEFLHVGPGWPPVLHACMHANLKIDIGSVRIDRSDNAIIHASMTLYAFTEEATCTMCVLCCG